MKRFFPRCLRPVSTPSLGCVALIWLGLHASVARSSAVAAIVQQELLPPSRATAKTLFVQLSPEATGIKTENRYSDPRMWGDLYQEFLFGAIGTGVAIGDYDGDGRPDLFVVSKTESCRLFRNLGDWKFEDVTEKAGVGDPGDAAKTWKQGATFVDVNNDGKLDLYLCRFNAPNRLYINQGDGTFKDEAHAYGLDVVDACGMAEFCDYDRDGWLDVHITANLLDNLKHPNGQRGYLFHNNANGTFTNVTEKAGITGESQSHSSTWWDYDNDGWPDLYVANDFGTPDPLYHNNRDGTFTDVLAQVVPHTAFSSMGADTGDVNNDGLIDFFVADMAPTTHQKDQRSVADSRARSEDYPDNYPSAPKYHRNALLINTGLGRCLEAAFLAGVAATDWTWSVRFEDLDNDGKLDLFVNNGMNVEQNVDVNARMMAAESTTERIRIMRDSPPLLETHLAYRNLGALKFESVGPAWGLDQKGISFGAAFGDLDGDGDVDLVYSNYRDGVTVLRNEGTIGNRTVVVLHGTTSNRLGVGAVVRLETKSGTQVRQLWLARGYMSSSEPNIHFGLGEDSEIKRLTVEWPSGVSQTFEQLPVNQRFTITETGTPNRTSSAPPRAAQFEEIGQDVGLKILSSEEAVDEFAQQRLLPARHNRRGPALAVGTFAKTGATAIVVGGTTHDPLRVLDQNRDGGFSERAGPNGVAAVNDGPVLAFDADGDGLDDLLVTGGGSVQPMGAAEYAPRLWINDGAGGFRRAPFPEYLNSVGAAAAVDFNHDGKLDLFLGGRLSPGSYPAAPESALFVNQGGTFTNVTATMAPELANIGMVTGAVWADVDGDSWPDLVLTLEWGTVRYFHNNGGKTFEDWTDKAGFASAGTGWWTGIATGDFNGDGSPDFILGNVGLNTQYQAAPDRPALLYWGDFKGSGTPTLIEAYYEGERIYPWRTRRDLGAAIPSILKKYARNDFYARASLEEILGKEKLAAAQRFTATELRSGVLLSQPNQTYHFSPLPSLAQIAPLQGAVVGDFDGDGRLDLYAVQNSFAPNPAVGRFDGGLSLLLRGDGRGGFQAVSIRDSGLVVPGDAKALVALDLNGDGWADFVTSRNHSTTLAWRNNRVQGRSSYQVVLEGQLGNTHAIGSRITAHYRDGSQQSIEISAGSGYYSQTSPSVFWGSSPTNPLVSLDVRWPTGQTTSTEEIGDRPLVRISEPKSIHK